MGRLQPICMNRSDDPVSRRRAARSERGWSVADVDVEVVIGRGIPAEAANRTRTSRLSRCAETHIRRVLHAHHRCQVRVDAKLSTTLTNPIAGSVVMTPKSIRLGKSSPRFW